MNINKKIVPWKLISAWMNPIETNIWKKQLYENLNWDQPKARIFGKDYLIPRKTIFIGEKGINYSYSGIIHKSNGWPDWFYPILEKVSFESNQKFNGCLINLYRNGNDCMGWHSDNERELKHEKSISSLSLGASRDFFFKHRYLEEKHLINLNDGDLLIMYPPCQEEWLHSLPVRKRIINSRINLTFRCYK